MNDLDRFDELLRAVELAGRDRGRQRRAIRELAMFLGAVDVEGNLRAMAQGRASDPHRPWFRFVDLTEGTLAAGRFRTTNSAGAFLILWEQSWVPSMTRADHSDTLLGGCPPAAAARVYLAVLDGLRGANDNSLAVENPTDQIPVPTMRLVMATFLQALGDDHADSATRNRVAVIIENGGTEAAVRPAPEPDPDRKPMLDNLCSLKQVVTERLGRPISEPLELPSGAGLAIPWADRTFTVATLMPGEGANHLRVSSGVFRRIPASGHQSGLEFCNALTRSNSHCPLYLVGPAGDESLVLQQTAPLALMMRNPDYLEHCLFESAQVAAAYRNLAAEEWHLDGPAFEWTNDGIVDLLQRSME